MKLPHLFSLTIASASLVSTAYAQTFKPADDGFNRLDTISMPSVAFKTGIYDKNPAIRSYQYDFSITDVSLFHSSSSREDGAFLPWQGTGDMATGGIVDAYLKVNKQLTAWGSASFVASHDWNVRWNSAIDYLRISPYVLADSVGGNSSVQQYRFNGGVSYALGRWNIGAEAAYRAEIAYRHRDPRIKDVVSDLYFSAGATYHINNWVLGGALGITVYNQEDDVDFYNPVNNIRTYCLTGLGSVYPRFSNGGTGTSAYEGTGLYGSLQLCQTGQIGLKFNISGGKETLTQRIREFNNLNLTSSSTYELNSSIIYSLPRALSFAADGFWVRRIGTENIFGTSVGNSYPKISSRQNYIADFAGGCFSVPVEVGICRNLKMNVAPKFGGAYVREFLREPNRLCEYSYLSPALDLSLVWRSSKRLRWAFDFCAKRNFAHTIESRLTGLTEDTERGEITILQSELLSSCSTDIYGSARCDFKIDRMPLLYMKGSFRNVTYSKMKADSDNFKIAIGATF